MSFDEIIDRRGSHCSKWDMMEARYGVSPDDGLSMWVADMDFRSPPCVQDALRKMLDLGVYGYFGDDRAYRQSIQWWMKERHGWDLETDWIFSVHGLVNGIAMCLDTFTKPGDGIILHTPIYHAFARVIKSAGREVVECEMASNDGRYELDFNAWDAQMTGKEKMFVLCSPLNPGGRVWTQEELTGLADFVERHDLILVSDEIHQDLVRPGYKHIPMPVAAPGISNRLVMLTAVSKTFNLAGGHVGNVIIEDEKLRAKFAARMAALGISPNAFGLHLATAAYSPEGAVWVDELNAYLTENSKIFDDGLNAIPGVSSMNLESTYLSWVDFSGTGMTNEEIGDRIKITAKIAANQGETFGKGGESFMRFNIGMPRSQIIEAVERIQAAFSDLQ